MPGKCGCPHGCARDCDAEARCPFCHNAGDGCPVLFQAVGELVVIPWKFAKTYRDAPHEYILTHQSPTLFNWFLHKLKTESRTEKFTLRGRTATYRYYYPGDGYKYWIIQNVLNRAKEVPDPDPQSKLELGG